jgi:hypothetical protein
VRDLFFEPANAIMNDPTAFRKIGRGMLRGALSLLSNTATGTIGTASAMTRSVGKVRTASHCI